MLEICEFKPEEIDDAITGMDGLQKIIVPILQKANCKAMAEQDIQQFQRHIILAKHALVAMGDFLESKMQKADRNGKTESAKLVYICAPLKGDILQNVARAKAFSQTVINLGGIPIAPQVMFDGVLNDEKPSERKTALKIGLDLLARCDELIIFSKTISEGMQAEIEFAKKNGIPVKNFFEQDGRL